ncbi:MAG: FAD-binding oxidoreductase [Paludibacteraceae bacterium]|nr:FAD-binding oxidoreductase [Paludibacteraceae bacterium]
MKKYIERLAWGTDAGFYRLIPQEVLHPATEADVQSIIKRAHKEGKHITFRAAGTSLSGQAISDSLLVVCGKKWEQYSIGKDAKTITLQPGIVGQRVNDILRPHGKYFTPDPASLKSAMIGGIVMNNASGMCCGVHANSYRVLKSVRIILPDGTLLDTGDKKNRAAFAMSHPHFLRKIEELRDRTRKNPALVERIKRKYSIKNVTGLTILPFIEYDDPFDIIAHLMVGSEGTLAFLSSITVATADITPFSASALLLFPTTKSACEAIIEMKSTGMLSAAEFFDRKAMRTVEKDFPELQGLPEDAGAVLIRTDASTQEELDNKNNTLQKVLNTYALCQEAAFTSDPALTSKYWAMRSGIFPAVGGTREVGTTCLIEDIAFPIEHLAEATLDLQQLFREHNYPEAVIYGHALEGNYHFILNQHFDTPAAINQYDTMMRAVVDLVVDKYHGSLKAEHGTGRNMAPFVRREWGDDAYELMCEVKQLFDPQNIMNPGVIFNEDQQSYLQNIKPCPKVHEMIDRCIECGFCEVNCVACGYALSSRQRIVVQREMKRLEEAIKQEAKGDEAMRREARKLLSSLRKDFARLGRDLCAGDGLCSTSCPIKINVGDYIHIVREHDMGSAGKVIGRWAGKNLATIGNALTPILGVAHVAKTIVGDKATRLLGKAMHKASGRLIPLWTPSLPKPVRQKDIKTAKEYGAVHGLKGLQDKRVVYFPSCLNQRLSTADKPLVNDMTELLNKAGFEVIFPSNMESLCCGTIWESKGMPDEAQRKAAELELALLKASENGRFPILCDQSPCLHRMRHTMQHLHLHEPAEFIDKYVLNELDITPLDACVAVHVTCSTRQMGLAQTIVRVTQACAKTVLVPEEIGCCAFAGDKGFTEPELNEWALRKLKPQIEKSGATMGVSNSRTCEIGLTTHSGIEYHSIAHLVNIVSKRKAK